MYIRHVNVRLDTENFGGVFTSLGRNDKTVSPRGVQVGAESFESRSDRRLGVGALRLAWRSAPSVRSGTGLKKPGVRSTKDSKKLRFILGSVSERRRVRIT